MKVEKFVSFEQIQKATQIILENKLHSNKESSVSKMWCKTLVNYIRMICLAKVGGKYVGSVIVVDPVIELNIGVFVKTAVRRQRIGTKLVQSAEQIAKNMKPKIRLTPQTTTAIKLKFFNSVGLADTDSE